MTPYVCLIAHLLQHIARSTRPTASLNAEPAILPAAALPPPLPAACVALTAQRSSCGLHARSNQIASTSSRRPSEGASDLRWAMAAQPEAAAGAAASRAGPLMPLPLQAWPPEMAARTDALIDAVAPRPETDAGREGVQSWLGGIVSRTFAPHHVRSQTTSRLDGLPSKADLQF
jgi:hypothetical protein